MPPPEQVSRIIVLVFMFVLAGWLTFAKFGSRVHRVFALFLALRATMLLGNEMASNAIKADNLADAQLWWNFAVYSAIALVPVLLYFLVVLVDPSAAQRRTLLAFLAIGALAAEFGYAFNHCAATCPQDGEDSYGFLALVIYAFPAVMAVLGVAMTRMASTATLVPRRNAAFLMAWAFFLEAILEAGVTIAVVLQEGWSALTIEVHDSVWVHLANALRIAAFPVAFSGLLYLLSSLNAGNIELRKRIMLSFVALLALTAGLARGYVLTWPQIEPMAAAGFDFFRLILPYATFYAILQFGLFDIQTKARWATSKLPVVVVTVATALVLTWVVGNLVGVLGLAAVAGGVAVVALLYLVPPEKFIDRWSVPLGALIIPAISWFIHLTSSTLGMLPAAFGGVSVATTLSNWATRKWTQRTSVKIRNGPYPPANSFETREEMLSFFWEQLEIGWINGSLSEETDMILTNLQKLYNISNDEVAAKREEIHVRRLKQRGRR